MILSPLPRWTRPLAAVAAGLAGSAWLVHAEWARQREGFDTNARIVGGLRVLEPLAAQGVNPPVAGPAAAAAHRANPITQTAPRAIRWPAAPPFARAAQAPLRVSCSATPLSPGR